MTEMTHTLRSCGLPLAAKRHPLPAATISGISPPHRPSGPIATPASLLLAALVTDALAGAARAAEAARAAAAVAARRPVGLD